MTIFADISPINQFNRLVKALILNVKLSCRKETVRLLRRSVLVKLNWNTTFCGHCGSIFINVT